MSSRTALFLHAAAAAFLASSPLAAGPIQRGDVPAEPAWVLHVDFDRLRPTVLGKHLLNEMEKPEAKAKLAAFQAISNIDLRRQLHGATLYSRSSDPKDGVLIVYADIDAERLTTLAKAANEYEGITHNRYVIHGWVDENKGEKDGAKRRTYAAIHKRGVVFGQRASAVSMALDVLDGTAAALAGNRNLPHLGAGNDSGMFLQAAARKMNMSENDPNAAVFRLAKLLRLEVGEIQQSVVAKLTVEGGSESVAQQISMILQGVVALMKLQQAKPETAKFAECLTVAREAGDVLVKLEMPAGQAVELLKADAARKTKEAQAKEP